MPGKATQAKNESKKEAADFLNQQAVCGLKDNLRQGEKFKPRRESRFPAAVSAWPASAAHSPHFCLPHRC